MFYGVVILGIKLRVSNMLPSQMLCHSFSLASVCARAGMHACRRLQRPEASDPLELQLLVVVNYHMGARNQTCVLEEKPVFSDTEPSLQPCLALRQSCQADQTLLELLLFAEKLGLHVCPGTPPTPGRLFCNGGGGGSLDVSCTVLIGAIPGLL